MNNPRTFDDFMNDPSYLNSAQTMSAGDGIVRTLLYVEAIYDKDHWKRVLNKLGFDHYFEITTFGQNSGRTSLLKLHTENKLSASQMIAIDADLDRLIDFEVDKFNSPFVFDTYVYSIEGIILDKKVVGKLVDLLNLTYEYLKFDFDDFMRRYAARCYQELSKVIGALSGRNPSNLIEHFKNCDLSACDVINELLAGNNEAVFNMENIDSPMFLCQELHAKGIEVSESYFYIRGHALRDTLDCLFKKLKDVIDKTETSAIRAKFSDKSHMISEEISRMRSLVNSNYVLDTFLMAREISEENVGVRYLSNKVKETVDTYLLH